jgi:hypothetical protein
MTKEGKKKNQVPLPDSKYKYKKALKGKIRI